MAVMALLATALVVIFWPKPAASDPLYQGKPLSYWLQGYGSSISAQTNNDQDSVTADFAVKALGPKSMPFLLQLLREKHSTFLDGFYRFAEKKRFLKYHHLTGAEKTSQENNQASQAFAALNFNDRPKAIPQLIQIFNDRPNPGSQQIITTIISEMGPQAAEAVPFLIQAAANTNDLVRNNSLCALGNVHADPEQVVPLLIRSLQDSSELVRAQAAASLSKFDQNARSALPALVVLFKKERALAAALPPPSGAFGDSVATGYLASGGSSSSFPYFGRMDMISILTRTLTHLDPALMGKLNQEEHALPK